MEKVVVVGKLLVKMRVVEEKLVVQERLVGLKELEQMSPQSMQLSLSPALSYIINHY